MNLRKILILVEGQTEEIFVNRVLQPFFGSDHLRVQPVIVKTRRTGSDVAHRGGKISYAKFKKQINELLRDSTAIIVTTLFDYYALNGDFPGRANPDGTSSLEKARFVENAIERDLDYPRRLNIHLSLHDFEGPLFCDIDAIADQF